MVFFTCNACGEALKKNQVEKHYMHKCRSCEVLTCIDCHKDFPGDSYQTHLKCISEDEKYGGKGWTAKANANKGERKQQAWIDNLQALVADPAVQIDSDVRGVLDTVMQHENIPRKRQKFINFVKNIRRNVRPAVIEKTWEFFEQALKPKQEEEPKEEEKKTEERVSTPEQMAAEEDREEDEAVETKQGVKMFTGIKEESKKKKGKEEKKKQMEEEEPEAPPAKMSKKEKKQKLEAEESEAATTKMSKKEKKLAKKRKRDEQENDEPVSNGKKAHIEEEEEEAPKEEEEDSSKVSFTWEEAIEQLLQQKGGPVKVSKVKKSVVKEYLSSAKGQGCHKSEEQLHAKVEKKLKNNKRFKISNDKVELKA